MDNKSYHSSVYQCRNRLAFVGSRKSYSFNNEEKKALSLKNYSLNLEQVWRYKKIISKGKTFSASQSSKICNSVVQIYGTIYKLIELLLLEYPDSTSCAVCFVKAINTAVLTTEMSTPGIFKVIGIKSPLHAFPCQLIEPNKFITIYSDGCLTHICKLPNTLEAE